MGLPWIRLDTTTFDHPKMLSLMDEGHYRAIVVHMSAMTYSGKHGLDGYIPRYVLRVIGGTPEDAERLMNASLWLPAPNGWDINGWKEYQFSSSEEEERRRRLSERGRKAAAARWNKESNK